jgi:predicted enzyme related to lactoylglutathione lyase
MAPTLGHGKICYLEVPVVDIGQSADFFSAVAGWQSRRRGDGALAFDDGVGQVSGAWVTGRPSSSAPGMLVYIMVDSVAAALDVVVERGGEIVQTIGADLPEITARFRDPAGNVFGLYQEPGGMSTAEPATAGLSASEAAQFAARWLPAWTGNNPELLASFYSDEAFYLDPGVPNGIRGKAALLSYFGKLLGYNPNWVWTQIEGIPMERGFLNKWHAAIPVGQKTLQVTGVCLVQLDPAGKITRNEVYFDRSELLAEIHAHMRKPT